MSTLAQVTVTASNLCDASGITITNATISFQPVLSNGTPTSFKYGGASGGQVSIRPVTANVVNGVFTITLADTTQTTPINVGYAVTCVDNETGEELLGSGYGLYQPPTHPIVFDQFAPDLAGQATVQYGPTGLSAYQEWLAAGNSGTLAQFVASLTSGFHALVSTSPTSGSDYHAQTADDVITFAGPGVCYIDNAGDAVGRFRLVKNLGSSPLQINMSPTVVTLPAGQSSEFIKNYSTLPVNTVFGTDTGVIARPVPAGQGLVVAQALPAGAIERISMTFEYWVAGGTMTVALYTLSGSTLTPTATFSLTPTNYGDQTFNVGTDFPPINVAAGQYIGFYGSSSCQGNYQNGGAANIFTLNGGAPSVGTGQTYSAYNGTADLAVTIAVNPTQTLWEQLPGAGAAFPFGPSGSSHSPGLVPDPGATAGTLRFLREDATWVRPTFIDQAFIASGGRTELLHEQFAVLPSGFYTAGSGTWTIASGGGLLSPTATADSEAGITPAYFSCERRTYAIDFQLLAANTQMGVASWASEALDSNMSTSIIVNGATNTLMLQNTWTSAEPGTAVSQALAFTLALNTNYRLMIQVDRRRLVITLADPKTGTIAQIASGSNTATAPYAGNGSAPGCMVDQLCFRPLAGQFLILGYRVVADQRLPRALILGDSITQGINLPLAQRWSQLVANQIGPTVISGRSGCDSRQVLSKCSSELPALLPDFVIVMIGTNDNTSAGIGLSAWETNMAAIITACQAAGAAVIACTLPPASGRTQSVYNSMNAWLLARTDIALLRFDLALTTGNDGVTQNASLFDGDGIHPNANGCIAMSGRAIVDVPWLLNAAASAPLSLPIQDVTTSAIHQIQVSSGTLSVV